VVSAYRRDEGEIHRGCKVTHASSGRSRRRLPIQTFSVVPDLALRARVDTLAKLALVVLISRSNQVQGEGVEAARAVVRMTAAELARWCGCYRVTAQRTLTTLHQRGVPRRVRRGAEIVWEILAALAANPSLSDPASPEATAPL
jgi:hypothetical protein